MTFFRKILTVFGASALVLLGSWGAVSATTTFIVQQGGTGAATFSSSNLLYGAGTNPVQTVATTSVTCSGSTTCTTFTAIGPSPITISSTGGGTVTQINTTWPVIGGPITTTGTLSFGGLSTSSPIAAGAAILYATGVNTLASTATSTLTGTGPISVSNAPYIIGASGAVVSCATASGSVAGCLAATDFSKFNSATTTFSTGLTYTLGTNAVTVNTSQNIATLSNLTTNGILETSGGVGTLGVEAYPLSIAHGGTATTTFKNGYVVFADGTTLKQSPPGLSSLFWDNSNFRLGIGTTSPGSLLSVGSDTTGTNFFDNSTTTKKGVGGIDIADGCFSINGACVGGGGGGGSTGGYQFIASTTDFSASSGTVTFTGLSGYKTILVVLEDVTSNNSDFRGVQVSSDNGSTFYTTSGDYIGNINNTAATELKMSGATTGAVSNWMRIDLFNVSGVYKPASTSGNLTTNLPILVHRTEAMDALQVISSGLGGGTNPGSGSVWIYGIP